MSIDDQVKVPRLGDRAPRRARRARRRGLPAIGIEAEFATIVDDVPLRPEDVFGSPRRIVRGPMVHRTGRSYHLPTGGAVYFDTGVIELATPMIEIERGCGARGTRALWESLGFLRQELDAWERRHERTVRLVGFSTHYNVSFDIPAGESANGRTAEGLAYLLTHVLAAPVMLLAANRRSTGVGVRPRGDRIEVTADFTPDAGLMAATATLIVGIARAVMAWPSYDLGELSRHRIPVVRGFRPVVHSSRHGWVARHACYPANPFTCDVNAAEWPTTRGQRLSLREMAGRTTRAFWRSISALGDPLSLQLIAAVMRGRAPSLLELPDRPARPHGRLLAPPRRRARLDTRRLPPRARRGATSDVPRRDAGTPRRVGSDRGPPDVAATDRGARAPRDRAADARRSTRRGGAGRAPATCDGPGELRARRPDWAEVRSGQNAIARAPDARRERGPRAALHRGVSRSSDDARQRARRRARFRHARLIAACTLNYSLRFRRAGGFVTRERGHARLRHASRRERRHPEVRRA